MDPIVASAIDLQYAVGKKSQRAQEQAAENKACPILSLFKSLLWIQTALKATWPQVGGH